MSSVLIFGNYGKANSHIYGYLNGIWIRVRPGFSHMVNIHHHCQWLMRQSKGVDKMHLETKKIKEGTRNNKAANNCYSQEDQQIRSSNCTPQADIPISISLEAETFQPVHQWREPVNSWQRTNSAVLGASMRQPKEIQHECSLDKKRWRK